MAFEQRGLTVINARRIQANSLDAPFRCQPACGVGMKAGKMELRNPVGTFLICSKILFGVRPKAGKTCVEQNNRAFGDLSMSRLPRLQVGDGDLIVSILL